MSHYQSPDKFEKLELPKKVACPVKRPHIDGGTCTNPTKCMIALAERDVLAPKYGALGEKGVWVDENGVRVTLPSGMIYLYDLTKPTKQRAKEFDAAVTPEERAALSEFTAHLTLKNVRHADGVVRGKTPEEIEAKRLHKSANAKARAARLRDAGKNASKRLNPRFV